ncbi:ead/Ea22-like family protein [Erwinia sp. AnSW2-5]|uniref:ead/Ea22-like family protein n=1 Tax=Erwinia sp. AnSW2-5 TaxID=3367692 RepID=UPI00385BB89A
MNTQQLKELAQRATGGVWRAFINEKANVFSIHTPEDPRCGDIIDWMGFDGVDCSKKQKARNARFIAASNPDTVIALIERLEAAERERDDLRAEITRRDAAAGEPVAWKWRLTSAHDGAQIGPWRLCLAPLTPGNGSGCKTESIALYTAAQPAVLPPEKPVVFGSDLCQDIENYGYNLALADTRQLGAQQQKVVELPAERFCPAEYAGSLLWTETEVWNKAIEACRVNLDAANVKYEVKK